MTIDIRPVKKEEVSTVFEALKTMSHEHGIGDRFSLTPEKLQAALFSDQAFAEAIVATHEGNFAGVVLFSLTNRNFTLFEGPGLYIHSFLVPKIYRCQGVGTKLMKTIEGVAKERSCDRIDWLLLKSNTEGAEFFKTIPQAQEVDYVIPMRIKI